MYIDVKPGDTIEDFGAFLYQPDFENAVETSTFDSIELDDIPEDKKDKLTDGDTKKEI